MQRERKREQQRERFYAREERKRAKRNHKNSLPEGAYQPPSSANAAAAVDVVGEHNNEGMKETAAAA